MFTRTQHEQMFKDTDGKQVTRVGDSTWGHYEASDELIVAGALLTAPSVLVPTAFVDGVAEETAMTVVGVGDFTMQFWRRTEDGALSRIALVEA